MPAVLVVAISLGVLLLSCAAVLGADSDIAVFTAVRTNQSGSITTKEVFTREGQTNLVRNTSTKAGSVQIQVHRFYHSGLLVGMWTSMPDSWDFISEPGCPYSLSFQFDASRKPKSAVIGTKDGIILDAFSYTNGMFVPVASSLITKANDVGSRVRSAMQQLRHERKKP